MQPGNDGQSRVLYRGFNDPGMVLEFWFVLGKHLKIIFP